VSDDVFSGDGLNTREPIAGVHCDAKEWTDNWTEISAGPSGGQGSTKKVAGKGDRPGVAFLKILNKQKDRERRKRVHREVASLETLQTRGVPRLIETNARHWEDIAFKLYAVSEFIAGETVSSVMASGNRVTVEQTLAWTDELCRIIEECHGEGVIHRDIKPDNIIISNAPYEAERLNLVDFGMAFVEQDTDEFVTGLAQGVGNHFLRLPEFHPQSLNKTDPRSDVTSAAGILFFLLTGREPATLTNEKNEEPHQRDDVPKIIRGSGLRVDRLQMLFDRAFDQRIDYRFQNASELRDALSRLAEPEGPLHTMEQTVASIREHLSAPSLVVALQTRKRLAAVEQQIRGLNQYRARATLGDAFDSISVGLNEATQEGTARTKMGFYLVTDPSRAFIAVYDIVMTGTEIVVTAAEPSRDSLILRIPADSTLGEDDLARLEHYIVAGVRGIFNEP
jgi:serine/threonine protein kinase